MNILHMKYAVEVASAGSLNVAAKALLIAPSSLSRAIRDLERSLGTALFARSPRGMALTPQGEGFIHHARDILSQIEELENAYNPPEKQPFSVSVPRAGYIAQAFVRFSAGLRAEARYRETSASRALRDVLEAGRGLAIIRYESSRDQYFREFFQENGLASKTIASFRPLLLLSAESPLAGKRKICLPDLRSLIEVAFTAEERPGVLVSDRASQLQLLAENPLAFAWASPTPETLLRRWGLVQRKCADNERLCRDVLVHPRDYSLTDLDRRFLDEVRRARRRAFS